MNNETINLIREVLSKDRDSIATNESIEFINKNLNEALKLISDISKYEDLKKEDKVKTLVLLGLGRDKTIYILQELKLNREDIKKAKNSMDFKQNNFRKANEKELTRLKIKSTNRRRRFKVFEDAGVEWEYITKKYISGEPLIKISDETGVNVHMIKKQLEEDGIYDESKSTILKKYKADMLYDTISNDFIIDLIKENPLDCKYTWWKKAKKEYPWLLRRQMFQKLKELNLERTKEEENEIKRIKALEHMNSSVICKKNSNLSHQLIKVNTENKIKEVFGSSKSLVELYMKGELGSYSKIADLINKKSTTGVKVSTRQIEKAITRHPEYIPKKSHSQLQLFKFVKNSFPQYEVIEEYVIPGTNKRIDVFIKEIKVGLEFNGDYWHSNEVIKYNYGILADEFHKLRAKEAKKSGIKICYVWESDWNNNYCEIENLIINEEWDSILLNKTANENISDKVIPPSRSNSNSRKS